MHTYHLVGSKVDKSRQHQEVTVGGKQQFHYRIARVHPPTWRKRVTFAARINDPGRTRKIRNSLVRKACVRPKKLSARLPVFRHVRGSSADEVLGHFPLVAALVGELQGARTVHISAGRVAGDQGAALSAAARDRHCQRVAWVCLQSAHARETATCCRARTLALTRVYTEGNKGPSCVVATASFPAKGLLYRP